MSLITTHILDTSQGRPAQGVVVTLSRQKTDRQHWETLASGTPNADGRVADLLPDSTTLEAGIFRLRFAVGEYFAQLGVESFYPKVDICFQVQNPEQHYHVPLLLNPFGYTTYRGS